MFLESFCHSVQTPEKRQTRYMFILCLVFSLNVTERIETFLYSLLILLLNFIYQNLFHPTVLYSFATIFYLFLLKNKTPRNSLFLNSKTNELLYGYELQLNHSLRLCNTLFVFIIKFSHIYLIMYCLQSNVTVKNCSRNDLA